jgi:hypothetical protein
MTASDPLFPLYAVALDAMKTIGPSKLLRRAEEQRRHSSRHWMGPLGKTYLRRDFGNISHAGMQRQGLPGPGQPIQKPTIAGP